MVLHLNQPLDLDPHNPRWEQIGAAIVSFCPILLIFGGWGRRILKEGILGKAEQERLEDCAGHCLLVYSTLLEDLVGSGTLSLTLLWDYLPRTLHGRVLEHLIIFPIICPAQTRYHKLSFPILITFYPHHHFLSHHFLSHHFLSSSSLPISSLLISSLLILIITSYPHHHFLSSSLPILITASQAGFIITFCFTDEK